MMQWFIQPAVNIFTTVHPFLSAQDFGRHECHVRTRLCCSAQPVNDIHRHVLSCGLCRDGALVICAQQLNGRGTLFHIYQVAVYCSSQHAGQLSLIISWPSGCSLITSLTPSLSSSRSHSCSLRHFIFPSLFRMLFFLTYSLSSLFISCLFDHSVICQSTEASEMYDPSLFSFSLLLHCVCFAAPTPHVSYCIHPLVAAFCLPPFLGGAVALFVSLV